MKFNVSLSDCEKSVAINATLVAFSAVAVIVLAVFLVMLHAAFALALLVYAAIKLDRAVAIKKEILADESAPLHEILLRESSKSIGASSFLLASFTILAIVNFIYMSWFIGIFCLALIVYGAIELSVVVSMRNIYIKNDDQDKMTKIVINDCTERTVGATATLLAMSVAIFIEGVFALAVLGDNKIDFFFVETMVANAVFTLLHAIMFIYAAVELAMADKAKKNYARQAKAQLEAPEVLEEVPVEQTE